MIKEIGAITKPLIEFNEFSKKDSRLINAWIRNKAANLKYNIYNSVDIRCSGFKIAPVDTNIFPSGFHLLDPCEVESAAVEFRNLIEENFPSSSKLLLIPESFNRNLQYLQNIIALTDIFKSAGYSIRVASEDLIYHDESLNVEKLVKKHRRLVIESDPYSPDVIILNNDLTAGVPEILKDIEQPIIPSVMHGWYARRKSCHISCYANLAREFCKHFDFDPWLIIPEIAVCTDMDFKDPSNSNKLQNVLPEMLQKIHSSYKTRGLDEKPYIFIKADNGTFGMGITNTEDIKDNFFLNKKMRHSISSLKGGVKNEAVLLQEGIRTIFTLDGFPAENMFYFINGNLISSIIRYNTQKNGLSNLNSSGMFFKNSLNFKSSIPLYHAQALVARLAVLAVLYEL